MFYLNTAEAARFIRWDCSDWQPHPAVADADNQLASAILETLAANRGKTLYCALDQSDTWTKRQVYDHAHAHNDRDRTQYDGSQGQGRFRGFTAGQAGWLTDGEHGITGVSPERIFEFPQVKKKRRRYKTITVVTATLEVTADNSRRVRSAYGPSSDTVIALTTAQSQARTRFNSNIDTGGDFWLNLAEPAALTYCEGQGYNRAVSVATGGQIWEYFGDTTPPTYTQQARQARTWTATCEKTKKRRVRR